MRRISYLFPLCSLFLAGMAMAASPVGLYRGNEGPEVAAELVLRADGSYAYALAVGALDEESQGRWEERDGTITLITEPKPVPPRFAPAPPATADTGTPPYLSVTLPNGRGLAGIDFVITCADEKQIADYTQSDGWNFGEERCAVPQWIELREPIHDIASERYPIAPGAKTLHFILTPNDIGHVDLTGATVQIAGDVLVLSRAEGQIHFRRASGK